MNRSVLKIIVLVFFVAIIPLTLVAQDHKMAGELGIDLSNYKYVSDLKDQPRDYSINRIRSGHFLGLSLGGPLVNSHFANYSSLVKMTGIYFDSKTDSLSSNEYVNPQISSFYGQATFLPNKPYPLKLYLSSSEEYSLRYEASNRTDRLRLRPELSIVRRYRNDRNSVGGMFQVTPSEKVKVVSELKHETSESNRIYDFGEQLDIWVDFVGSGSRPGDTSFVTAISNDLPDSVVLTLTYLGSLNIGPTITTETIDSGRTITRQLFLGDYIVEFQSPNFNRFLGTYTVTENLLMTATFRDPASPNDIDQEMNSFTTLVKLGGESKLTNESYLEVNSQKESFQKQTTDLTNISNDLKYRYSKNLSAGMLTTYSNNKTVIEAISSQTNSALSNQSTINYSKRRGISAAFLHSYGHNVSEVGLDILKSDMNLFSGKVAYPFKKYKYNIEMKNNVTFNSDNTGYINNLYSTEIINKAEVKAGVITTRPRNEFKYSINNQENPDQKLKEIENIFKLDNKYQSNLLGDIQLKSTYSYRNRWSDEASDTKNRLVMDLMLIKKFSSGYRLTLMVNQDWEKFGGWTSINGAKEDVIKPLEHKFSYKVDIQGVIGENLSFGANMMIISQGIISIKKYGASIIANIPKINLPIKSFILAESRDLAGLDRQTQFSIETKTNYRIRRINLVIKHVFRKENQLFETYSINEIRGTIYRNFDVY